MRERWPNIALNVMIWRFEVWSHNFIVHHLDGELTAPLQLHYQGLSLPKDARVECWAYSKGSGHDNYRPWGTLSELTEPGDGAIPLQPALSTLKKSGSYTLALRLFPTADGARPGVDLTWVS